MLNSGIQREGWNPEEPAKTGWRESSTQGAQGSHYLLPLHYPNTNSKVNVLLKVQPTLQDQCITLAKLLLLESHLFPLTAVKRGTEMVTLPRKQSNCVARLGAGISECLGLHPRQPSAYWSNTNDGTAPRGGMRTEEQ